MRLKKLLNPIKTKYSHGCDEISVKVLKLSAPLIVLLLIYITNPPPQASYQTDYVTLFYLLTIFISIWFCNLVRLHGM